MAATINLPTLISFADEDNFSLQGRLLTDNDGVILADNLTILTGSVDLTADNSSLVLPGLTTYSGNNSARALNNGTLDLRNLTEIPTGELEIRATGLDSLVDVSSLVEGEDSFEAIEQTGGIILRG